MWTAAGTSLNNALTRLQSTTIWNSWHDKHFFGVQGLAQTHGTDRCDKFSKAANEKFPTIISIDYETRTNCWTTEFTTASCHVKLT